MARSLAAEGKCKPLLRPKHPLVLLERDYHVRSNPTRPTSTTMEEEEHELKGKALRGIGEALCSTYGNYTLPPHPNPSSRPTELFLLELKRRPAAGKKRVRKCALSFIGVVPWRKNNHKAMEIHRNSQQM